MAFFGVTLETLEKVWAHPNADRLELAKCEGMDFQFVVGKGSHTSGDRVLYFPVDSVLPVDVMEKLGLVGKLSGQGRNRVKTVTLRNEISQGLVADPVQFLWDGFNPEEWDTEKLTEFFRVTKYEPPVLLTMQGRLVSLPEGVEMYDIEGADRYVAVAESLMDQLVYITEKVEGTNFALGRRESGTIYTCQRSNEIEEMVGKRNVYIQTARDTGLVDKLVALADKHYPGQQVTFRGELIGPGIQGNIYKLQRPEIRVFDIKVHSRYVNAETFLRLTQEFEILTVPTLAFGISLREWLNGKTIREASNGKSLLNPDVLREGIVIKPLEEQYSYELRGRTLLKMRDPVYLSKEKD